MSDDVSGAASSGGSKGGIHRDLATALAVVASAVCFGGLLAIAEVSRGTSTAISLSLMGIIVAAGTSVGFVLVHRSWRRNFSVDAPVARVSSRGIRRAARAHRRAIRRALAQPPEALLVQQLSARYGVPVERVAWHVWRINGELVEATLNPATGQLIVGGRELSL
jgi:hypothetical protein